MRKGNSGRAILVFRPPLAPANADHPSSIPLHGNRFSGRKSGRFASLLWPVGSLGALYGTPAKKKTCFLLFLFSIFSDFLFLFPGFSPVFYIQKIFYWTTIYLSVYLFNIYRGEPARGGVFYFYFLRDQLPSAAGEECCSHVHSGYPGIF